MEMDGRFSEDATAVVKARTPIKHFDIYLLYHTLASASREISTETASTSAVGQASPMPMYPLAGRE